MTQRRYIVAFTLIMVAAVAWAPGSVAAGHGLVVGSQHTTDTDFQNATTLTNVSVTGSGNSASVTLGNLQNYNPVTDEGDGSPESTSALVGDFQSNTARSSEVRINPDVTGNLSEITWYVSSTSGSDYGFTVDIYLVEETPDGTVGEGTKIKDGYDPDFSTGNQTIDVNDTQVSAGTNYTIEFVTSGIDGDGVSDFLVIELDDSASSAWYGTADSGTTSEYANMTFRIGSVSPNSAQYVSANHSVEGAEQAAINITDIGNVSANLSVEYYDGSSWRVGNNTTVTSTGNHTLLLPSVDSETWRLNATVDVTGTDAAFELADESILFTAISPSASNLQPSDGTQLTESEVDFSVAVNDTDFGLAQGDSVTATLYIDGQQEYQNTVTSNQTVTTTQSLNEGGDHDYYWQLNDSYGESTTSTNTIKVPANLTIFSVQNPDTVVNDANATVRFYSDDQVFERNASDGTVNLTGLPVDESFSVTIEADGYYQRTTVITSIYDQEEVYILPTSADEALTEFTISDPSNTFGEDTIIRLERAITKDYNSDGDNTTKYQVVAGDVVGVSGYVTELEKDQRYRIIIESGDGDTRVLGSYTPKVNDRSITLEPEALGITLDENETYAWQAYMDEDSTEVRDLVVEFTDPQNDTTDITFTFHEQGNKSNTLSNETVSGPVGEVKIIKVLNGSDANTTWVVGYTATRNDSEIDGTQIVGPQVREQMPVLPDWMQEAVAVLFIIMTAGLFSKVNASTGAVTTSLVAGGFWYATWLPYEAGAAIMVALVAALAWKFHFTGGPT